MFLEVGLYVDEAVISTTQKQAVTESSNLIVEKCIIWRHHLKLFIEINQIDIKNI